MAIGYEALLLVPHTAALIMLVVFIWLDQREEREFRQFLDLARYYGLEP